MANTVTIPEEALKPKVAPVPELIAQSRPVGDMGGAFAFDNSVPANFSQSLTVAPARSFIYWSYKYRAKDMVKSGLDSTDSDKWVGKEEFNKAYALGGRIHFEDVMNGKMPRALAQQLLEDHIGDAFNAANASQPGHGTSEFMGGLASSFLSPVDLTVNAFIPEARIAKMGMGVTAASRAGVTGSIKRIASRTINGAVAAEAQNIAVIPVMAATAKYNQTPFTFEDAEQQMVVAPLMGAAGGFMHAGSEHFNEGTVRALADAAVHASMTDKDPTLFKKILASDPKFQEHMQAREATKQAILGNDDLTFMAGENPPENLHELTQLGFKNVDEAKKALSVIDEQLKGAVTEDDRAHFAQDRDTVQAVVDRFEGRKVETPDKMSDMWSRLAYQNPQDAARTRKAIIDEVLTTKDKRIRAGATDDERFLADAWKNLFGVDLNYIDPELADRLGIRGYISRADPSKAYIRAGSLNKGPDSMLFLAGHELGHAVRMRDPAMWKEMVNAMMTTAHDDGGELANTWAQVVKNRTGKGVWAGMDLPRKMDETFASVLGRAATSEAFWDSMYLKSPGSAKKLTGMFLAVGKRLENFLNQSKYITPETRALHDQLADVLQKADAAGTKFNQRLTEADHQWGKAASLYEYHADNFKAMMRRLSPELSERGLKAEADLVAFDQWADTLFPKVSEFTDYSGSPGQQDRLTTIFKNKTINSNNPAHWLMTAIFKNAKEGTPERELFDTFNKKNLWWDSPKALAEYQRKNGALIQFKKNTSGTWDIAIYKNDDFKFNRWSEVFDNMPNSLDMVTDAYVTDQLNELRGAWSKFVGEAKEGEVNAPTHEFSKYIAGIPHDEFMDMVSNDPSALWHGFVEHLEERMADFRWEQDSQAYQNLADLVRRIDPLTRPDDAVEVPVDLKALNGAWETLAKEIRTTRKELEARIERPAGDLAMTTKEFFEQEFQKARSEVMAELTDIADAHGKINETRERAAFAMNFAKEGSKISKELSAVIDEAAHDRMRAAFPQYGRVMKIQQVVKDAMDDHISLAMTKPGELPAGYQDGSELFGIKNPMTEMDYDDLSYMAAEPDAINQEVIAKTLSVEEAKALTMKRFERDVSAVRAWTSNTLEGTQAAELAKRLEKHEITFDLFAKPNKPEGRAKNPADAGDAAKKHPLETQLESIRSKAWQDAAALAKYFQTGEAPTFTTPDGKQVITSRVRELVESFDYHLRQTPMREHALEQALQDMRVKAQAEAISAVHDYDVSRKWENLAKQGLGHVASRLDAEPRKRVRAAGVSVAGLMEVRRDTDLSPLFQTIISNGLEEAWKNGDEDLARALIREVSGVQTEAPGVKQIADVLGKTYDMQAARLNSLGANIRFHEKYVGPQVHNPYAIKANEAEFVRDLVSWVDWEKVQKLVGDNTDEGFDPELYAKQFLHEITNENKETPPPGFLQDVFAGGNVADAYGRRRILTFKDTFAYDYDMKYGSGNFLGLITEHLQKRAEAQVMREEFGSNWKKSKDTILFHINQYQKMKPAMMNKARLIDLSIQQLAGELNHPENARTAAIGQAIRNTMNSVSLWMSGVSSITDLGNVAGAFNWMGYNMKDLNKDLWGSIGDHLKKGTIDRELLMAQGAGIHALLTGFARTQAMDGPLFRLAQKASDFTFRWNGQEAMGRVLQYATHDLVQQQLGRMADTMTPEFENFLRHYDITVDEWKQMGQHAAVVDGLIGKRLAPDMIPDANLSNKLRVAIGDFVHHAIIEPSVSDKAMLTFGTKAGTKLGEALRCVMQYKGYPLAMVNRIQARFSHAYGDQRVTKFGVEMNRGMAARLAWGSSMIALATTAIAMKDLLRGREPLNPLDTDQWTIENASRVITQAGVGPFAVAEQFLSPRQLLGPAPGTVWDLGTNAVTGNGYGLTNSAIGAMPGSSFAPLRESSKAVLGAIFADSYGVHYQKFLQNLEREQGQTSIFLDKPKGGD